MGKNQLKRNQPYAGTTKRGFADLEKTATSNIQKCVKCSKEMDWPNSMREDVMESVKNSIH
jgi:hypothetical protein